MSGLLADQQQSPVMLTEKNRYGMMQHREIEELSGMVLGEVSRTMAREAYPLNTALSTQRKLRGWSQSKLAELIGASEEMISKWERGKKKTSPFYQEKLCELFGMNAEELGFLLPALDDVSHKLLAPKSEEIMLVLKQEQEVVYERSPDTSAQDAKEIEPGFAGTLLDPSFHEQSLAFLERFSHALAKPSNVDETMLHYLEMRTEQYWRDRQRAVVASCDLLSYVWDHLQKMTLLLEGSLFPEVRTRLCSLASKTAQLVGELLLDMSYYAQGRKFHEAAITAAQEAHNYALEAVAWGRTSLAWTYLEKKQPALTCIQKARRLARGNAALPVCAWLAAIEAEAQANLCQSTSCLNALDEARRIENSPSSFEESYLIQFDNALLQGYQGVCFRRLYRPEDDQSIFFLGKAQQVLLEALASLDSALIQRQPTFLTDLADTYLQQGEIEEACKQATQALKIATRMKLQKVIRRLHTLRQELEPWKETSYVTALDHEFISL